MNEPKLRFPEFTGDWEQHKLSELATMHARIGWQNLRTSEFLDTGDYMLITGTDFEDGRVNYSTCHYVEKERYDQDKNIQIKNGSILITKDGTLGKVAYVEGLDMPATLNAGVFNIKVRDENETDGKYLFQFLRAPFLMNYVAQKVAGSTIKHLNQNILVDFPISMPNKEEQQKIASLFTELDSLIQSAQKELEGYRELKQGMLQKMFPKKGEAVPEIRFPEFTDDWEWHKVGELLEERNEQAPMSDDYPLMAFIANQGVAPKGERYDRSALVSDETGKKYKRTEFGDFIYSSNNLETGSIGLNKYGNACISPVYSIFKPAGKTNLDFLGRRFLRKDFINEMIRWRQGAVYGQWKIHEADFMKIGVRIPSVDEQKKIGQYFNSLDNLIMSQQQELDSYKELKKGLLQQMFC